MYPSTSRSRFLVVVSLVIALILLGCTEIVGPSGSNGGDLRERRAESPLNVTPGNHSAFVGDVVQYTATTAAGGTLTQSALRWSIADSRIARIDSTGRLTALVVGSTSVRASVNGSYTSVPITVLARASSPPPSEPPPTSPPTTPPTSSTEPVFNPAVHQSLWADDFESSTSSASIYARYATQSSETGIHLDATGGLGASKGMRIDWQPRSGCADDSHFVEGSFPAAQEVVVQYSVRYQSNFVFDWIGRGGPCSGNAKKLFFLWPASGSRFDFISENHALGVGSDYDHPLFAQNLGAAITPEMWGNGQWHRITLRVRQSSISDQSEVFI